MVALEEMRESNARIASELPSGLVAVFFGGTSGIGETTLEQFAKRVRQPRIYFIRRREVEGQRIKQELNVLNPGGEYHYRKCDASLLKNVDELCRHIMSKEPTINLLFVTVGTLISRKLKYFLIRVAVPRRIINTPETEEGLPYATALTYYARIRFITNLFPLIARAPSLRRVVTVFAATKEGPISTSDFPAQNLGITAIRGHVTSMLTLALEAIAKKAPNVSFIHDYPGFVETGMSRELTGLGPALIKVLFKPVMALLKIPIEEVSERQVFFASTAPFPPRDGEDGVSLGEGVEIAIGTDGKVGGGVYSIDYEAEGTHPQVLELLARMREDGTAEKAWKHSLDEFVRITGSVSI